MLLAVDLNDKRPLHEQAADAIRRAIAEGEVAPGDRLPPARDLAAALQINANTVLRALRQLRDEGLLEFRRGRGVSVLRRPDPRVALREKLDRLLEEAERHGYGRDAVIAWIEEGT
ncbi:GntR family transcriptional regulator [Saccharopolyspora erythraea NRRL 2338]|uniref:GntR family transcriptional regulator n=1 Tax=Saccharopolyspora erythraea TaxID=1836 RepID=A0ABN1BWQ9_SACER|nr:GntR family transcriptional regulator [Saccharopolyspora erythraea D]PFG98942.1 GntR family transcriptional regulator [Saccharopolyspora erythraea NRRL 2338]QRK88924.1 GntR family transcriptional regulator [Saccharopolyspora erythraea]